MGLFGALFAGVSGLDSQSNKIGIISNNISNVNTVGYKQGQASFDTLVVPSGTTTFSPGGVIGANQQLVNQQGLISATTSSTDVAITGNGFVVVSNTAAGINAGGTQLYTRAGSFTQDSNGNFVNSNGFYLQGLPIGSDGTAGQPNTANLKTVKINQSAVGSASATTTVVVQSNLNATQTVFPGASKTATMQALNGTSAVNVGATGKQILVGNDVFSATNTNNLVRGNTLNITSSNGTATTTDTYVYDGFTIGRSATIDSQSTAGRTAETTAGGGLGDAANVVDQETGTLTAGATGNVSFTVSAAALAGYTVGGNASIATTTGIGGYTAAQLTGEFKITNITGNVVTVNVGTSQTAGTGTGAFSNRTRATFTGNILNATSDTGDFLTSGTSNMQSTDFAADSLKFTITLSSGVTQTFTYSPSPNPSAGSFNSLASLAQAIGDTDGLTATVANDRLYVSATDANNGITFSNGDAAGAGGKPGIDWLQELGLNTTIASAAPNVHRFNSLTGLANSISASDPTNLTATVTNPNSAATLSITEADPRQTITFTDGQATGSVLNELGIVGATRTSTAVPFSTGTLALTYDANDKLKNMSSGKVTPQFSHDITVYDAQGQSHTVALNFLKLGTNTWAVEATAVPATDVNSTNGDGQIAAGVVTFNGDGSLKTNSLPALVANWTNGANPNQINVDFGLNSTDTGQIGQAAGASTMQATQNGAPTGQLTGVNIDQNGFVIASFSNGQTQKLYQVPLAVVNNPNGLEGVSGNAYQQTLASGEPTLNFANQGGAGEFTPSSLEQSNVDLSTQLTNLIVAQQAYGANSKVLTVTDQLLQQLDQIIQ